MMWAHPRVLVLDEPTSMLTREAVDRLMASVRELASGGVAVIPISAQTRRRRSRSVTAQRALREVAVNT